MKPTVVKETKLKAGTVLTTVSDGKYSTTTIPGDYEWDHDTLEESLKHHDVLVIELSRKRRDKRGKGERRLR